MKKIVFVIVLVIALIMSSMPAVAAVFDMPEMDLQYIGADTCVATIEKGLNMNVSFAGILYPKAEDCFDTVKMTLKVKNFATGSAIYSEAVTTTYNALEGCFKAKDSCTVPTVGSYLLEVTFKCYKEDELIETITLNSKLVAI